MTRAEFCRDHKGAPVPIHEAALNQPFFRRIWGGATGWLDRPRKMGWTDLIFLLVVVAVAMGIFNAAQEWGAAATPPCEPTLDLSPRFCRSTPSTR